MSDFPYLEVAARMAERTAYPFAGMRVEDYYATTAIWAVIKALTELGNEE